MKHTTPLCLFVLGALTPLIAAAADLKLAAPFSDHAVFQQNQPAPIWGWADPETEVMVEFAGQKKIGKADASGKWSVTLDPLKMSAESRTLTARGKTVVAIQDVMVGEVWLASGQSNMGFSLGAAHNASAELPKATDPLIRFFTVKHETAVEPQSDIQGKWDVSSPDAAKNFSAVAYFFAQDLRSRLQCPVGILHSSWGGTAAQTWLSMEAMRQEPPFLRYVEAFETAKKKHEEVKANPQLLADYHTALKQWQAEIAPAFNAATKAWNDAKAAGKDPGPKPAPARPEPANPDPTGMPSPSSRPSTPSVIYNAMIAPLIPYGLRGAIWYQGEANGSAGVEYRTLFPRLIGDWRQRWGSDFPFLFVQLANWDHDTKPSELHDWPWLREAQLFTLKAAPKTGMAVTIDIGNPKDVHPKDKLDVGRRLALAARKLVYGENVVASGPIFRDAQVEGAQMRVRFTDTDGRLIIGRAPWVADGSEPLPNDRLSGFRIAGEDRRWVDAEAKIEGDTVVVSSPQVPKPVAVRYGWANSPRCNLYNHAGLPASPFRTDDWPLPGAR